LDRPLTPLSPTFARRVDGVRATDVDHAVAASPAFFRFTQKVTDPSFLFLYYQNILVHLRDAEKCAIVRKRLLPALKVGGIRVIQPFLETDNGELPRSVFEQCYGLDIVRDYCCLLKEVIVEMPDGLFVFWTAVQALVPLLIIRPAHEMLLFELMTAYVVHGPAQVEVAISMGWPNVVIGFLVNWYRVSPEEEAIRADFTVAFNLLKELRTGLSQQTVNHLLSIHDYVAVSCAHVEAYEILMTALRGTFALGG
jgi:hypothetical protein